MHSTRAGRSRSWGSGVSPVVGYRGPASAHPPDAHQTPGERRHVPSGRHARLWEEGAVLWIQKDRCSYTGARTPRAASCRKETGPGRSWNARPSCAPPPRRHPEPGRRRRPAASTARDPTGDARAAAAPSEVGEAVHFHPKAHGPGLPAGRVAGCSAARPSAKFPRRGRSASPDATQPAMSHRRTACQRRARCQGRRGSRC